MSNESRYTTNHIVHVEYNVIATYSFMKMDIRPKDNELTRPHVASRWRKFDFVEEYVVA